MELRDGYMYSRSQKKVPVPFRFTMDKRVIFFHPVPPDPFRPFSLLSRAHAYILYIERSTDRSIEREASAEFSSRLKQERTVRSY